MLKNRYEVDFFEKFSTYFQNVKNCQSLICEPIYLNNFEALISIYYVCQTNLDPIHQWFWSNFVPIKK